MKRMLSIGLAVVIASGCSSVPTLRRDQVLATPSDRIVGVWVSVQTVSAERFELRVTTMDGESLRGETENGRIEIPLDQIVSLQVERKSVPKTVGVVAAVLTGIYLTLAAILVATF